VVKRARRAGGVGEIVGFLNIRLGQIDLVKFRASFLLTFTFATWLPAVPAVAEKHVAYPHEFSGSIIKQVNGKKYQAQVFAKADRLRLEYKYAIRTDYGYAAIEIIRLDRAEAWYLLAQRKELLVTPLDPDDVLPMQPALSGERSRTLVGEATAVGRPAQLYEVQTDRHGRMEQWYEWVDAETGIVLKLVSRDRDWSFTYERIRWSPQPTEYFNEPPGYQKRTATVRGLQG
jgi:hypothetical protein